MLPVYICYRSAWGFLGSIASPRKKARKPYTITKPQERWSADEHDRFLDALLMFGRDWKKIEEQVRTKTTIQIRSHAQKYFLKVQKHGLGAGLPPMYPRRGLAMARQSPAAATSFLHGEPQCTPVAVPPGPSNSDAVARGGNLEQTRSTPCSQQQWQVPACVPASMRAAQFRQWLSEW